MNYKAVINGTLIFIAIYALNALFVYYFLSGEPFWSSAAPPSTAEETVEVYAPITTAIMNVIYIILNALIWFTPGIYIGYKLKHSGVIHGAAIGAIGFVITYVVISSNLTIYSPYQESYQVVISTISTSFLCALAAGVGELYAIKGFKNGSNNAF